MFVLKYHFVVAGGHIRCCEVEVPLLALKVLKTKAASGVVGVEIVLKGDGKGKGVGVVNVKGPGVKSVMEESRVKRVEIAKGNRDFQLQNIQEHAEILDPLLAIFVDGAWLEIPGSKIAVVNI